MSETRGVNFIDVWPGFVVFGRAECDCQRDPDRVRPHTLQFLTDNLLVRVHFITMTIIWTGSQPYIYPFDPLADGDHQCDADRVRPHPRDGPPRRHGAPSTTLSLSLYKDIHSYIHIYQYIYVYVKYMYIYGYVDICTHRCIYI
jgi:hypothetical protein